MVGRHREIGYANYSLMAPCYSPLRSYLFMTATPAFGFLHVLDGISKTGIAILPDASL